MKIELNRAADEAYHKLRTVGGRVSVVGGAVRDTLMKRQPNDIDLLVQGVSASLIERMPGFHLTGDHFGVFRYRDYRDGTEVEVALPRTEVSTGPGHKDFEVVVDHNLPIEDDLRRRDFTMNAMAIDLDSGALIDPLNGEQDTIANIVMHIGDNTFRDDPLRILRAFVLVSRYNSIIGKDTCRAIALNASRLTELPAERILAELVGENGKVKIFDGRFVAEAVFMMNELGVLHFVFPTLAIHWDYDQNNKHHQQFLGPHQLSTLKWVAERSSNPYLRIAALLHDIGKPLSAWVDPVHGTNHFYRKVISFKDLDNPTLGFWDKDYQLGDVLGADHEIIGRDMARSLFVDLKFPTAAIEYMCKVIESHMWNPFTTRKGARKFLNKYGDIADDLLILRYGDQNGKLESPTNKEHNLNVQRGLIDLVRAGGEATQLSDLAVNGHDLIESGMKPGPSMGKILDYLTECVIENPELNEKGTLITIAHDMDWEPNEW